MFKVMSQFFQNVFIGSKRVTVFLSAFLLLTGFFFPLSTALYTADASSPGSIVGWGRNDYGQTDCPADTSFISVSAGTYHSLGLRSDGSVAGWGGSPGSYFGEIDCPAGNDYVAVSAGSHHSIALKSDGSVAGWGSDSFGQVDCPPGNDFVSVAAGYFCSFALKGDGSIVGWGRNDYGETDCPAGNDFIAVSAGSNHCLALKSDGSVAGWGNNNYGQTDCPAGNDFIAVSAGSSFSLALKSDGSVVGWGNNNYGQIDCPTGGEYIEVSAGYHHSLALKSDGSIVGWGSNDEGEVDCPAGVGYTGVSTGREYSLAAGILPNISSISPLSGSVGGELTLTGSGFGSSRGESCVRFGSIKATEYTSWSETVIKCRVPAGVSGIENVIVTTQEGISNTRHLNVLPRIHNIDPPAARFGSGALITISGISFGSSRGNSFVSFGSTRISEYITWSDTCICCAFPDSLTGEDGPVHVIVTTEGGDSNSYNLSGHWEWYFAEGSTREGFDEWLTIQNPGENVIEVHADYMFSGEPPQEKMYKVPPTSRTSIYVNDEIGKDRDVSARLWSESEFYAERPMYFNYKQSEDGYAWTGGHCTTGADEPRTDWYFAEGTTREGFEEWLCIQNPNNEEVIIEAEYLTAGSITRSKQYLMEPESRISVFVNGETGSNLDVSAHVRCDLPIVVERPVYFDYGDEWTGGHVVLGRNSPETAWYFAEGSTRPGFEEWLTIMNGNEKEAGITCTFIKSDGSRQVEYYAVNGDSRWTLNVCKAAGVGVDTSVVVKSDIPVVAERAMYFSYKEGIPGYGWTGGHDVAGATETKRSWFFPEGCTYDNFDEYICVGNMGAGDAAVTLTFMLENGETPTSSIKVSPHRRVTVKVADVVGRGHDVSTRVVSDKPIVAERVMYFNYRGWTGGHDVVGY